MRYALDIFVKNFMIYLIGYAVVKYLIHFFVGLVYYFLQKNTVWNDQGYGDLNHLNTAVKKHTESEIHISGYFKLKTFLSSSTARIDTLLDKQRRIDIQLHNEKVAKNREILKRLINAVRGVAIK